MQRIIIVYNKILFSPELKAYSLGLLAVASFSLTLPASKILSGALSPIEIGIFRSFLASIAAIVLLIILRPKIPSRNQIKNILITSIGIVYGFPILTALGMKYVPVSHGAVVLAALPLSTAIFGTIIMGNIPSIKFWLAAITGFLIVLIFTFLKSNTSELYYGDLALFGSVLLAGFGYAKGGALSLEMKGWEVMCWMLAISFPVLFILTALLYEPSSQFTLNLSEYMSLAFLAFINSFIAFFLWYRALALGGIQHISQLQLLQPFFTLLFAFIFMGDSLDLITIFICISIIAIVGIAIKSR